MDRNPSGEHTARYNFIPSGKYVFQVRATDEKGHWSDKITEVKVTITPYFYKSGGSIYCLPF